MLYEGYLLYPYRRSAQKNRTRFQFGVLMPPAYRAVDDCEPSASQTECLVECPDDAGVDIRACASCTCSAAPCSGSTRTPATASDVDTLSVDGTEYTSWDEAVEREQHLHCRVADLLDGDTELRFDIGASEEAEELTGPRRGAGRAAGPPLRAADAAPSWSGPSASPGPTARSGCGCGWRTAASPQVPLRSRDDGLKLLADRRAPADRRYRAARSCP